MGHDALSVPRRRNRNIGEYDRKRLSTMLTDLGNACCTTTAETNFCLDLLGRLQSDTSVIRGREMTDVEQLAEKYLG